MVLIVATAKKWPLINPKGCGEPLHGNLAGFTKIKPKAMSLRIVYRPVELELDGKIRMEVMEVIAIGPKDKLEVYEIAAKRVMEFKAEIARSSNAEKN